MGAAAALVKLKTLCLAAGCAAVSATLTFVDAAADRFSCFSLCWLCACWSLQLLVVVLSVTNGLLVVQLALTSGRVRVSYDEHAGCALSAVVQ
jgi:hypothetical protein